jgi:hypothetical protein
MEVATDEDPAVFLALGRSPQLITQSSLFSLKALNPNTTLRREINCKGFIGAQNMYLHSNYRQKTYKAPKRSLMENLNPFSWSLQILGNFTWYFHVQLCSF